MIFYFVFVRRLLTQLETYTPATTAPAKSGSAPQPAPAQAKDHVTYELYYRPEQAQFSKNAKVNLTIFVKLSKRHFV